MAEYLHKLLGTSNQATDSSIYRLERASGEPGLDVRLTAEIIGKTQLTIKSLGLDPRDSSAKEVYAALVSLVEKHDNFISRHIGIESKDSITEVVAAIGRYVQKIKTPKTIYAIKHSTIKKFLTEKPPKRSMKALGYRSVSSMLKREPIPHVLAVALHTESKTWRKSYYKLYSSLALTDFEERTVEICMPHSRYWDTLGVKISSELQTNILSIKELGAIVVLPLPEKKWRGICLVLVSLLLIHIQELRMYSSFFKLQQMKHSFGEVIASALTDGSELEASAFDETVHWRIVHTYFSRADEAEHPEFFEPHVSIEDMAFRRTSDVLCAIEPALDFWTGNEYVGGYFAHSDQPVSFNLLDVALSYANNMTFENRIIHNMRSALWDEVLLRYMSSPYVRSLVLDQLSTGTVTVDG